MRLLFVCSEAKLKQSQPMISSLEKLGVQCTMVNASEHGIRFRERFTAAGRRKRKLFEGMLDDLSPDFVMLNSPRYTHYRSVVRKKIPMLVYWWDMWGAERYERQIKRPMRDRLSAACGHRIIDDCIKHADAILAEADSASDVISEHYPNKRVITWHYSSVDANSAHVDNDTGVSKLKHPCVGLLQNARTWGRTGEMVAVLPGILRALPHVTFYWAGGDRDTQTVLDAVSGLDNFEHLGELRYPHETSRYLSEIDVFALVSGLDMSPYSLKEAQLAGKPVLATDSGGVAEAMQDGTTGFLIPASSTDKDSVISEWARRITQLTEDPQAAEQMGRNGRRFIEENWSWDTASAKLCEILEDLQR